MASPRKVKPVPAIKPPAKHGSRAGLYTPEIAEKIIQAVSDGIPLAQVCRDIGIGLRTWYDWLDDRPELVARFARAREAGEEMIAVDCLRIANTPMEGIETTEEATTVTAVGDDGEIIVRPAILTKTKRSDMLGHRKLQIETRLKLLAKWNPKKWGEKIDIEAKHSGGVVVTVAAAGELDEKL